MTKEVTRGDWLVRIGSQEYPVPSAEILSAWVREGRVPAHAMIIRPGSMIGEPAREVPELTAALADSAAPYICRACGYRGMPEMRSQANGCVAVALLFFLIIPGIIYLVWAATTESDRICPNCKTANTMIPITSPAVRH